ncbi:MAG: hypothetical protein AVDCRST_MAG69-2061, partial [uncultured Solirubrobacteraceae bacterium]
GGRRHPLERCVRNASTGLERRHGCEPVDDPERPRGRCRRRRRREGARRDDPRTRGCGRRAQRRGEPARGV